MVDKSYLDLVEVLTKSDGQFNEEINAYVTAYPVGEDRLIIELEYVDTDNDHEVVDTKVFTVWTVTPE